ncbi:DMT family transporter [Cohaesibacter celericrescens]|nr:DMT family transporter [Cohaesibacter celericrescens]
MTAVFERLPLNIRAILIMFIAMMCFSTMSATIKELGQSLHVTVIIVIRQGFMVLFLVPPLLKSSKGKIRIVRKDLFLLRAFLTFFSILGGLTAIINLPLATATTLSFTRTFFITVFAVVILKETVGIRRIGALVVGFTGILIIARPFDMFSGGLAALDNNIIFAMVAAATIAANQVIIRIHTRYDQPTVMVTGQALLIGLAMIPLAYLYWTTPSWKQIGLIALTGALASFAQWLMVHAFKWTKATTLAPFDYMRLLFSTAFGWFLFDEFPDGYTWLGAAVIFASTFYIMRREAKLKKSTTPQTVE